MPYVVMPWTKADGTVVKFRSDAVLYLWDAAKGCEYEQSLGDFFHRLDPDAQRRIYSALAENGEYLTTTGDRVGFWPRGNPEKKTKPMETTMEEVIREQRQQIKQIEDPILRRGMMQTHRALYDSGVKRLFRRLFRI
jgi:hypothetical protein